MPTRRLATRPITVHKFGGASVADGAAIKHAASIIVGQRRSGRGRGGASVVVVSAMAGVTDALIAAAQAAARGDEQELRAITRRLQAAHAAAARSLAVPARARTSLV